MSCLWVITGTHGSLAHELLMGHAQVRMGMYPGQVDL